MVESGWLHLEILRDRKQLRGETERKSCITDISPDQEQEPWHTAVHCWSSSCGFSGLGVFDQCCPTDNNQNNLCPSYCKWLHQRLGNSTGGICVSIVC